MICMRRSLYSYSFVGLRLLADWLQLWLIVVNPQW
jgi:hypothetical protein